MAAIKDVIKKMAEEEETKASEQVSYGCGKFVMLIHHRGLDHRRTFSKTERCADLEESPAQPENLENLACP